jgi:hypothetical protein
VPATPHGASDRPNSNEHGPTRAERIPRSKYSEEFLRGLQITNKVHSVGDDWDGDASKFPPHVNWVIYPNGDLERVGFD